MCEGIEVEVKLAANVYGTDWYERGNKDSIANAISKLVTKLGIKDACKGDCKKEFHACEPVEISIDIPKGKGSLEVIKDPEAKSKLETFLLKVKPDTKVTVTTKCECLPTNPD